MIKNSIYMKLLILIFFQASGAAAHGARCGQEFRADRNQREFEEGADYVSVYHRALEQFDWHQDVRKRHSQAMPKRGLIIDAGGGTGLLSLQARRDSNEREVHIVDLSSEMLAEAVRNGIPPENTHHLSYTELSKRFGEGSVDGIMINNSLYILSMREIRRSFSQFSRVLREGGVLSVSNPKPEVRDDPARRDHFLDHLRSQTLAAEAAGLLPQGATAKVMEANRRLTGQMTSPTTAEELIEIAQSNGFELMGNAESYYGGIGSFLVFQRK